MEKSIDLTIEEYTSPIDFILDPDETLESAFGRIIHLTYRHYPVVSEGEVKGIVSQRDLAIFNNSCVSRSGLTIRDIMNEDVLCVAKGASMEETVFKMSKRKVGSAIVTTETGDIYGIFTSIDVMNAMVEILRGDI